MTRHLSIWHEVSLSASQRDVEVKPSGYDAIDDEPFLFNPLQMIRSPQEAFVCAQAARRRWRVLVEALGRSPTGPQPGPDSDSTGPQYQPISLYRGHTPAHGTMRIAGYVTKYVRIVSPTRWN